MKTFFFYITAGILLFSLLGCEAFVRKFTRKPKKERISQEEIVLVPEQYHQGQLSKEDKYREQFLFWKSWHDEWINSLVSGGSHKRQLSCLDEAIKYLGNLKELLAETKRDQLERYIQQLLHLRSEIQKDVYSERVNFHQKRAENLKRNILRDLSYPKVKEYLR